MKLRNLFLGAAMTAAGVGAYQNRDMLKAVAKLEKVQGDLFTRVENTGSKFVYLSKNDAQAEELFKDWVAYNGWKEAERIGEGYFFINDNEDTLTIDREAVLGGRFILWTASGPVE
ncbi:MAG: hypothetical protein Q4C56_08170 [Peptococcaceae bacterium]|nr:hypothetical protein [Peptococcaceae bacterium]